jgi:thiol:disulfide interchange protein
LAEKPSFNDIVGAILGLVALAVVAYLAAVLKSEQAAGAVIALLAAAAGWLYRGRVEKTEPPPPVGGRNG